MGSSYFLHFLIVSLFCFFSSITAQQPYLGLTTTDCSNPHNSTSNLGYFCNSPNRSCKSFLSFRSQSPYDSVSSISDLLGSDPSELSRINSVNPTAIFPMNTLVLVPIDCSCSGPFYQANISFSIRLGDSYFLIANNTLQGLSTCQSINHQNTNVNATNLLGGEKILVPVRCACPTENQTDLGFNYLLSYLVIFGDTVFSTSEKFELFGADMGSILEANQLQERSTINPFTTLLVPLRTEPLSSLIRDSPPPPLLPPPSTSPSSTSNRTWVYVLIAVLGGAALVVTVGTLVFFVCIRKRKNSVDSTGVLKLNEKKKPLDKKLLDNESSDILESISTIAQSVKVYSFKELQEATGHFSSSNLIKGTLVYRATINGDLAAIKKMNGDVSKELTLLSKINHFNLIRLSGICFNEGHWYLVYEYAANGPLSDWIGSSNGNGEKFLDWMQRIQIAYDVASGLHYLHSFTTPPHVHKNVKIDNILLDSDFRGKISNFGLVRSVGWQEGEFSLTRHIVGTRGYMAPEYLENGLVSTMIDVYAFGILMMEMLTGKDVSELYQKDNLQLPDILKKVLREEDGKEFLNLLMDPFMEGNYPFELAIFVLSIIDRCLKKDPSQRPSMDEIVQSLSRVLSSSLSLEFSNHASV